MILLDILLQAPEIGQELAIAPIVALGIAAAAGSAIGGIASAVSSSRATRNTNAANERIANAANATNERLMDKQNDWNREQWYLENEYNEPIKQVGRVEAAGINPIWAFGGDPGNAQSITGASAPQAVVPTMQAPRFDFSFIGQMASSVLNALVESGELGIKTFEADTHRRAQESEAGRNEAAASEARANAERLRLQTKWDEESFQTRLDTASQTLKNLEKQYDLLDANSEAARAKKEEIEANKDLIRERINEVQASIKQRDRELDIMLMNASTNQKLVKLKSDELELEGKKFEAQCIKWDNDTILQYCDKFAHDVNGSLKISASGKSVTSVGIPGTNQKFEFQGGVTGQVGYQTQLPPELDGMLNVGVRLTSAVNVLVDRAKKDPTPSNLEAASKGYGVLQQVQSTVGTYFNISTQNEGLDGVLNDVEAPGSFGGRSWIQ